jgi:hypothetical protein
MYAAHTAAGGMTSVYRQIGIGCQWVIAEILTDCLGLLTSELFRTGEQNGLGSLFRRAFGEIAESARENVPEGLGRAFLGDSRNLSTASGLGMYTVVITSPPYPNRMSYIRELRPYMYWLGYLISGHQAGELDWDAIGGTWGCATSQLIHWCPDPTVQLPLAGFAETVERISAHNPLLGRYVHKYFQDIMQHVRSLRPLLARQAHVYYVIGNSKFYDVMLDAENLYAAIFSANGFGQVAVDRIRKRSSKKELFEFVVRARAE